MCGVPLNMHTSFFFFFLVHAVDGTHLIGRLMSYLATIKHTYLHACRKFPAIKAASLNQPHLWPDTALLMQPAKG